MKVFHVFAVTLDDYGLNEVPHVRYHDYYVAATSVARALNEVLGESLAKDAAEVWGRRVESARPLIVTPFTRLNIREKLEQHKHWARLQDGYIAVPRAGRKTLDTLVDERFAKYMAEKQAAVAAGATRESFER